MDSTFTPWKRLGRLLQSERTLLVRIFTIATFGGLIGLSLPLGIQSIVSFIQAGRISTSWIVLVSFVLIGILISGWLQIRQQWLVEHLQQRIFAKSSLEFAMRLPRIVFNQWEKRNPAELMNRFFDVITIQKSISKLIIDFSTAILSVFFGLVLLALYHPFFILFDFILIFLLIILIRITMGQGLETSLKESSYKYKVAGWLEEVAANVEAFRMTPKSNLSILETDGMTGKYLDARDSHFKIFVRHYGALVFFKLLIAAGLLVLGSLLVIDNQIGIGQFVAAEIVILMITGSVEKIIMNLDSVYDLLTALDKVGHVTDLPLEEEHGTEGLSNSSELFVAEELSMVGSAYSVPIYCKKFTVSQGERVFIQYEHPLFVRTMMQLLTARETGFQGHLSFKGRSLKSISLDRLREEIGELWGRDELFSGTIIDNIEAGRPHIPFDRVERVLNDIGLMEDIRILPEAEVTRVIPYSNLLSSTMTKGILLARNLIDEPDILLIDAEQLPSDPVRHKKMLEYLLDPFQPWAVIFFSESIPDSKFFDKHYCFSKGELTLQS